jgi:hypothetical protein
VAESGGGRPAARDLRRGGDGVVVARPRAHGSTPTRFGAMLKSRIAGFKVPKRVFVSTSCRATRWARCRRTSCASVRGYARGSAAATRPDRAPQHVVASSRGGRRRSPQRARRQPCAIAAPYARSHAGGGEHSTRAGTRSRRAGGRPGARPPHAYRSRRSAIGKPQRRWWPPRCIGTLRRGEERHGDETRRRRRAAPTARRSRRPRHHARVPGSSRSGAGGWLVSIRIADQPMNSPKNARARGPGSECAKCAASSEPPRMPATSTARRPSAPRRARDGRARSRTT